VSDRAPVFVMNDVGGHEASSTTLGKRLKNEKKKSERVKKHSIRLKSLGEQPGGAVRIEACMIIRREENSEHFAADAYFRKMEKRSLANQGREKYRRLKRKS